MDVIGILKRKLSEKAGISQQTNKSWVIAEFLLEIPGRVTTHSCLKVRDRDKITKFEQHIGKNVVVQIELDAREYQGRWFNEVNAWNIGEYVVR